MYADILQDTVDWVDGSGDYASTVNKITIALWDFLLTMIKRRQTIIRDDMNWLLPRHYPLSGLQNDGKHPGLHEYLISVIHRAVTLDIVSSECTSSGSWDIVPVGLVIISKKWASLLYYHYLYYCSIVIYKYAYIKQ